MATTWYLKVKTLNDEHMVDLGGSSAVARAILEQAKGRMEETGAVTIAGSLVVNASDIVHHASRGSAIAAALKRANQISAAMTSQSAFQRPGRIGKRER